ncbi:hypothetical protein [Streptomyces sp. NPDC051569]|uniref:hypothetical protein n=1 Tax=Streptomyces sp. NPDC051569 TaxID=3365661 RepID=UPI0037B1F375
MQADAEETAPARADSDAYASARAHVETLLRDGEAAEARRAARSALDDLGPDGGLYALLGRGHAAEDDDDHDDRAELVYREGLAAFPDHLDILAAYAELCLNSDVVERPGRYRRGPELAERLRELAPGSPQALSAEQAENDRGRLLPREPSADRVQRYDARQALAADDVRTAAHRARALAAAHPHDGRLVVRAETLTALARPGGAVLRPLVRAPLGANLVLAVLLGAAHLTVPALHLPGWTRLFSLLFLLPVCLLGWTLRGARHRAWALVRSALAPGSPGEPVGPIPPAPSLAPVPPFSLREKWAAVLVAVVVVGPALVAAVWANAQYRSYPRYEVSAPEGYLGMDRLHDSDTNDILASMMESWELGRTDGEGFGYLYGDAERGEAAIVVAGGIGDFRDMPANMASAVRQGLLASASDVGDSWSPDPGRYGGRMECTPFTNLTGLAWVACGWTDKGSFGTVVFLAEEAGETGNGTDHDAAAELARDLRQLVVHPVQETPETVGEV